MPVGAYPNEVGITMKAYNCGGYSNYTGHCGATDCEDCYPGCSLPCDDCEHPRYECQCDEQMEALIEGVYDRCTPDQKDVLSDGYLLGQWGLSGLKKWLNSEGFNVEG